MNISESITKVLESNDLLGGKFYKQFFNDCPHLKSHFAGVDMDRQSALLTTAIVLVETVYSKEGRALSPYLQLLGRDHQERGIAAKDFADWTESMIVTLADFHGDDWDADLEKQWRLAIGHSVAVMLEAYE